jgi:hypothetical protein
MSKLDLSSSRWRKSSYSSDTGGECVEVAAAQWRKSSHSGSSGGDCVEVADAVWHKSSHSGHSGGECVEVAGLARVIAMRDSKDPSGPTLVVEAAGWQALLRGIKAGEYETALRPSGR